MSSRHLSLNRRQLLQYAGLGASALAAQQLLAGCAVNPVTGENQFMMISEQQEVSIDKQQSPFQFSNDYGITQDSRLNAYVNRVGQEVASRSHRPRMPYSFSPVNAAYINAYAFPGGTIATTRGILAELDNEAELAALLGHEIGHVNARHTAQQLSKTVFAQMAMAGLSMATSAAGYGGANSALQSLGGLGASALLAHYSRDNEREADVLGMEYMAKTGYSPEGMAQLMELLIRNNQREPNALQAMFSTHPMSSERLANVRNAINSQYSGQMRQATNRERYMDETANLRRFKPMLNTLQKASAATAAKKLNEAGSLYSQALQQAPGDYAALLMMSKFQMGTNNNAAAESFARQAMQAYPQEPQARLVSGVTMLNNKRYDAAYQELSTYDRMLPGTPQVNFYQGYALEGMGRREEAAQEYANFLKKQNKGKEAEYAYKRLQSWGYVK